MSGRDERQHHAALTEGPLPERRRSPASCEARRPGPDPADHLRLSLRTVGLGLLFAVALVAVPTVLGAQEAAEGEGIDTPYRWIQRGFRGGLYGGWVAADRGQTDLGPGPSAVFGGRLRVRVSSPLSLEANVGYSSSDRWVIDPRPESGTGLAPVDTVGLDRAVIQGAMQFALTGARTWHGLQPYALVGAGLVIGLNEETSGVFEESDLELFRYELNSAPVVQAGLGVEWLPGSRFGLGFEVRDHLWRIKAPDGFFRSDVLDRIEELGLPAPRDSDWTHNVEFSVTLWRYF